MADLHHRIGGGLTPVSGQFHCLTAFCQLERAGRSEGSAEAAQKLLSTLLTLQRDDGSWPGIVDPHRGEAAALYPALTVTQVALAPSALRIALDDGLEGDLTGAMESSVLWARGANRLGFDLVHHRRRRSTVASCPDGYLAPFPAASRPPHDGSGATSPNPTGRI